MRPFSYIRPESLSELLEVLVTHGPDARILAGGTDVIVRLRSGHMRPRVVVDVKRVPELSNEIVQLPDALRIGARVVMSTIMKDDRCRRDFPALAEAAAVVGSVQIRNRATLAGNLCNASPACDTAPPLLVYGALVNTVSPRGRRRVPLAEFFQGPGRTILQSGELVESIDLPRSSEPAGAAFGRITRRYGVDLATINLACLVTANGETRFAYGAVGPRPFLVGDTSGVLADARASDAEKEPLIARCVGEATPITDVRGSREYRVAMLDVMSRRTLQLALARRDSARAAG